MLRSYLQIPLFVAFFLICSPLQAQNPIFYQLPVSALAPNVQNKNLIDNGKYKKFIPGISYFSIDIAKMHLPYSSSFWSSYYPAARMFVGFRSPQEKVEFETISPPSRYLELTRDEPDRIAVFNKDILAPAAYVDGSLKIEIGLVGIKSSDTGREFLSTLADASDVFGVKLLSQALPVAKMLKSGIDKFMGLRDVRFEAGVDTNLNTPSAGIWVLIWPGEERIDKTKIKVTSDATGNQLNLLYDGGSLDNMSWALVRINVMEQNPNWRDIPGLLEAQYNVYNTLIEKGEDRARDALKDFKKLILTKYDLQWRHRYAIYQATEKELTDRVKNLAHVYSGEKINKVKYFEGTYSYDTGEITSEKLTTIKKSLGAAAWYGIPLSSMNNANNSILWRPEGKM